MGQAHCPALRSVHPVMCISVSIIILGGERSRCTSNEGGLTAEVLIVIVGARGRRGE